MIVSLLFGRGGSKGLPGKNVTKLLGRKVLHYPIIACQNSKYVEKMYCSTDGEYIAEAAREMGLEIIDRPDELCTDESLIHDAIVHAAKHVTDQHKVKYFVITLCNAPNLTTERVDKAIEMLDENPKLDSVISVGRYDMYQPERARTPSKEDPMVLEPYVPFESFKHKVSCDRSAHLPSYFSDGGFTVVRSECLIDIHDNLLPFLWMGKTIGYIEQPAGGGDIDYAWQIPVLEEWLRAEGFEEVKS
tara:strand:- start:134157 stop:134894 length:738 start_codon:yes stop_codon:yes gene_type:complete